MGLLNSASLVVTPNGYKASKLYSVIPADGSGDMTFTRAGDTATRVNSSGLIETVLANKPRLDYTSSTCPKLLLEPQRTNLFAYSNGFDNADWFKNFCSVNSSSVISPDGGGNSFTLTEDNNTNYHYMAKLPTFTSGVVYTQSLFVKNNIGNRRLQISFPASAFTVIGLASFNLQTLTSVNSSNVSSTIQSLNNGWIRVTATMTATASTSGGIRFSLANIDSTSIVNYTGDGTSGIYIYGAQLEAGAYPTSYIPTTTATVTRNVDNCGKTGISSLLDGSNGTIYFHGRALFNTLSARTIVQISDGSDANQVQIIFNSVSGQVRIGTVKSSVAQYIGSPAINTTSFFKAVFKYDTSNIKLFINGALVASAINLNPNITGLSQFNMKLWYGGLYAEEELKELAYWKTAISDADAITLTTL